jgi:hypothetical protein
MHHIYNAVIVLCATFLAYNWNSGYPFVLMAFIITKDVENE